MQGRVDDRQQVGGHKKTPISWPWWALGSCRQHVVGRGCGVWKRQQEATAAGELPRWLLTARRTCMHTQSLASSSAIIVERNSRKLLHLSWSLQALAPAPYPAWGRAPPSCAPCRGPPGATWQSRPSQQQRWSGPCDAIRGIGGWRVINRWWIGWTIRRRLQCQAGWSQHPTLTDCCCQPPAPHHHHPAGEAA